MYVYYTSFCIIPCLATVNNYIPVYKISYLRKRYFCYLNKLVMWPFCIFLVLNSQPTLKDLYNLITPEYAAHWKVIGTLLGIEKGIRTGIERNFPNNVSWCCNELLEEWLERDTEASWKKMIQVIDSPAVTSLVAISSTVDASSQNISGNYLLLVTKSS